MIEIDGSAGEGGGQILRTSLALSICTGRAVRIDGIRARRPKPGLMRQHLTCVRAAVVVSSAKVRGDELGSRSLIFEPGQARPGEYEFDVGSAGSCTLVLQTILPALVVARGFSRLTLRGGTHNPMAPPYHFLERSFAPLLRRLGVGIELKLRRHGFYPAGGGEVIGSINSSATDWTPFDLPARGGLREEYAECLAPALPGAVPTRELTALATALGWSDDKLRTPTVRQNEAAGNALMATLVYDHVSEVFTSFGERGVSSGQVANALVAQVKAFRASEGALGPHLADQWLLPLALAVVGAARSASFTCSELTEHSKTNMDVIQKFLPIRFLAQESDKHWSLTMSPAAPVR